MDVTSIYTHRVFRGKDGVYLEQSQTSQHLKILRDASLVETKREGKHIKYRANKAHLQLVGDRLKDLAGLYVPSEN